METLVGPNPSGVIELPEEEKIFYNHPNITMTIKGDKEDIVLTNGSLVLTTAKVIYEQSDPRKVCVTFRYQNCITHGVDNQNLVCVISDLQNDHQGDNGDDDEEEEEEPDYIIEKLKVVDSLEPEDWVQLVGDYHVYFNYGELGQEKLNEVYQKFSECSAMNPDDNASEDEENMMDNDFITANDIDENGNIRVANNADEFEAEEGGYEDEDEEFEQILEDCEMGTKKKKGEQDQMHIE